MQEVLLFVGEESGIRLDVYLSENIENLSRSQAQKWIEQGAVLVNGELSDKKQKLQLGDEIQVHPPDAPPSEVLPEDIPLDIVFEDQDLLVVNKPRGMVVHPAPGNYTGTLVNALLFHCGENLSQIGGDIRPGIVHRIDKDTSGLLMVAKNNRAHIHLSEQIANHSFLRQYRAVVHGVMKEQQGQIDAPIGRSGKDRKKMAVRPDGRPASSLYFVEEQRPKFAMLKVQLETGRTHQIRVHMKSIHHPVVGDPVYGAPHLSKAEEKLGGQWLHAETLGFIHPRSSEYMEFSVDPPNELLTFWNGD